tara:strand:- start:129 stop:1370 length:1242 start_codon:yes stop_codon:yes gene_type:complete
MTCFDTLAQRIDDAFIGYDKQVKAHQASPYLSWCMSSLSSTYYPSYQYINCMGSGLFQRSSTYLFGSITPFIRDRFISTIIHTISSRYYQPLIDLSYSISDHDLTLFLRRLDDLLFSYWPQIRSWSFSELFSFLNHSCVLFNDYLGLPHDLYKQVKHEHYERCLSMYQLIRTEHETSLTLQSLCYLSMRANWIDSYLDTERVNQFLSTFPEELNHIFDEANWLDDFMIKNPYIHYSSFLYLIKASSKHILYELDNQGELLFDLLLIEHLLLQGHSITISTKHSAILNDVTYSDLTSILGGYSEFDHLKSYLKSNTLSIIDNGSSDIIPIRYRMSDAYINAYQQSDYLILKGQGNFESFPLKHISPISKHSLSYKKDHLYLFGLKSSFSQRSFSTLMKKCPLETLICYSTRVIN